MFSPRLFTKGIIHLVRTRRFPKILRFLRRISKKQEHNTEQILARKKKKNKEYPFILNKRFSLDYYYIFMFSTHESTAKPELRTLSKI